MICCLVYIFIVVYLQVKIWNLNMANSVMTIRPYFVVCTVNFGFTKNELAVGSAGSEDNRAYVYYKAASRPILCYDVDSTQSIVSGFDCDPSTFENDSEVFVSAVAWRPYLVREETFHDYLRTCNIFCDYGNWVCKLTGWCDTRWRRRPALQ
ncbi:hypothetical protein TELCIR_03218, partial [Teladorsagia circumcincta]